MLALTGYVFNAKVFHPFEVFLSSFVSGPMPPCLKFQVLQAYWGASLIREWADREGESAKKCVRVCAQCALRVWGVSVGRCNQDGRQCGERE
jgi:hypothetical protein